MNIDLTEYTIEEVVSLRNKCINHIYSHSDGYVYICEVRSYGRNWTEHPINSYMLQELCDRYDGQDGIVDVYSNNPNLKGIENYGVVNYIESKQDYEAWKTLNLLKHNISNIEKDLDIWDNKENVPFKERPYFEPIYSREDLEDMKKQLREYNMSFVEPRNYN